ncbi:MAG TPA: hypothetical protein VFQ53_34820 [Kofleriaceae bacterium]|nr:hypothetical protein [Kofleriaceae bacterium]
MSKLPTDFVKVSAAQPKQRAKRSRKASLISAEPVVDPKQVMLHLTDDEHAALEEARQKLHAAGAQVTLEQMIHRVFADWLVRLRTPVAPPAPAAEAAPAKPEPRVPTLEERIAARLAEFLARPVQMWDALARMARLVRSWR